MPGFATLRDSYEEGLVQRARSPEAGKHNPVGFADYHDLSRFSGDCDPSYEMLRYVCNRFELNMEQRFWLAFLYATCYCGATVYYIYNEFPDFENVDFGRLERWWKANRSNLYFQTDRRWIRSRNQWCDVVRSYTSKIRKHGTQENCFARFRTRNLGLAYDELYKDMGKIYQFGRYALFLYLEAVHVVTGFPMAPTSMDMSEGSSVSSRNGLACAIGRPDLNNHETKKPLPKKSVAYLQQEFDDLVRRAQAVDKTNNVWNLETTLCAYKKYRIGKRYVGYYLDRQAKEIKTMERSVSDGVCWSVLWDYRKETYNDLWLYEQAERPMMHRRWVEK